MLAVMELEKTKELFGDQKPGYRLTLTTFPELASALKSEAEIMGCEMGELATEILSDALCEAVERVIAARAAKAAPKGRKPKHD